MNLACVILAAGLGKRMNSSVPKALHPLCGRPMVRYVLDAVAGLRPDRRVVVVGQHAEEIENAIAGPGVSFARQEAPKGTGDALLAGVRSLGSFKGTVLVLNADTPLVSTRTLRRFLDRYRRHGDLLSVLSFSAEDPSSYGRIIRDGSGRALRIVEQKDASAEQKEIREVNSGIYAINTEIMGLLSKIGLNKAKGEYYLTDLFGIAAAEKIRTGIYCLASEEEMMGINTRQDLLRAGKTLREKIISGLLSKGVHFVDPASTYVHSGVRIGRDTVIYPNVHLEGATRVGSGCTIYANVRITDSTIEDRAVIRDSSVIEGSRVKRSAEIGPFAHLRPGSLIGPQARIGNFVEVKKSFIGERTKASHLSYIGDALIGKDVNLGAGTITCNFDGKEKHRTEIKDGVFIGSDTQLIAPVTVGSGAYVAAGSTITSDVPPLSLALSRTRQRNIEGWASKRKSAFGSGNLRLRDRRDRR